MRFFVALFVVCCQSCSATLTPFTFNQKLDHFNVSDTRTFPQRYWVFDDFWNQSNSAPVFLFLGLAAPFTGDMANYGVLRPALIEHAALGAGIENRYYGRSLTVDMLKMENLKYLTFEQSLEDTKAIQDAITKNYSIPNLKWFTFGASYSGMKSVIHRVKMPNRIFAAFASSAPVNFQYDMPNYLGHVGDVIRDRRTGGSPACYDNVRKAFAQVDNYLSSSQLDVLRKDFNICPTSSATDDKEKFAIAQYLSGLLADIDQYSFSSPAINPYASICLPFTRPGVDPYEVLKRIQWESSPNACTTVSYKALLDGLNKWSNGISDWNAYDNDNGNRAWGFEICNNLGFNVYCSTVKGCPMSNFVSQLGQTAMCQDVFGITDQQMRDNSAKFLQTYGGANPPTTRLLLTHGAVDCGYPYEMNTTIVNKEIYSITTAFVGHVRDINPPTEYEPVALYETRQAIAQILRKWVQDANPTDTTPTVTTTDRKTAGSSPRNYLSFAAIMYSVFFYSLS